MNEFSPAKRVAPRAGLLQFLKFCTVGVSSTVVDKGLLWLLMNFLLPTTPKWICACISFALGVSNGFFWNRRWTFQTLDASRDTRGTYVKFFFVNIVGLLLNLSFTHLFLIPFYGRVVHSNEVSNLHFLLASLCAAPIVVFWNFFANKHWTFKHTATSAS